jgi:uncharacterized protein YdaU (DUF1376 family)
MQEDGCYRRMLDLYYTEEKPLPLDREALYRKLRARSKADQKTVDTMLEEFFVRYDDGWRQGRCDQEIVSMQNKADANRENGTHGGRPRKVNGNHEETHSVSEINPHGSYVRAGPLPTTHNSITPLPTTPLPRRSKPTKVKNASAEAAPTAATWEAYAGAYHDRYGVEPIRNAKVNGQLSQFIDRIPREEAPLVAAYFVTSNRSLYVSARHCVDLLLRDAEGVRTEWATGRSVTETQARQMDKTAALGNTFDELKEELKHGHH